MFSAFGPCDLAIPAMDVFEMPASDGGETVDTCNGGRRRRFVMAWEIAADVERDVGGEGGEPTRLGIHVRCTVVLSWDDEGRHFDVDAARYGVCDGLFDGLQIPAEAAVESFLPTLEVDVHGVDMW